MIIDFEYTFIDLFIHIHSCKQFRQYELVCFVMFVLFFQIKNFQPSRER